MSGFGLAFSRVLLFTDVNAGHFSSKRSVVEGVPLVAEIGAFWRRLLASLRLTACRWSQVVYKKC